ncbi:unnamed protein product [Caenorhabditis angaria]|uniref:Glucosamine 6-phosphate N-acetyltransferase n=1 Tax=Caenorhabditis angaria TaxID=860376 RepID=A0A9P1I5A7_9PELO|nr:unnamed protein product [Caenorhabditis angaria]
MGVEEERFLVLRNEESLFDPEWIPEIKDIPDGLVVRPLYSNDYENGFLQVLEQLTTVGNVDNQQFIDRFQSMKSSQSYYVVVIEDEELHQVIAAATLVIEQKFIHNTGSRGRVEDVVVDKQWRGMKLGAILNNVLVEMAKNLNVYKLSLECKDNLMPFYSRFGYKEDVKFMVQRFDKH